MGIEPVTFYPFHKARWISLVGPLLETLGMINAGTLSSKKKLKTQPVGVARPLMVAEPKRSRHVSG